MMEPHVLVVEDESIVSMDIQRTLQRCGFRTSVAMSGEEALESVSRQRPDVVLMDIMLPGELDGIDTAAHLRKEMDLPVVYLTANADEDTMQRAMKTGPMGYLIKPFRERELISTIRVVMLRSEAEKRLRNSQRLQQSLLEAAGFGVAAVGPDGNVNWLNGIAEAALCRPAGKCEGEPLAELLGSLSDQEKSRVVDAVAAIRNGGRGVSFDDHPLTLAVPGQAEYTLQCAVPAPEDQDGAKGAMLLIRPASAQTGPAVDAGPAPRNSATAAPKSIEVPPPLSGEASLDPATGLPSRSEAERAIGEAFPAAPDVYAVAVMLNRFSFIRERFGHCAGEELAVFYSIHLAQNLMPSDELFRWDHGSFVALIRRDASEQHVVREFTRLCMVKLEKMLRIHSRTAMVIVSAASRVLRLRDCQSAPETIHRLTSFVTTPPGC